MDNQNNPNPPNNPNPSSPGSTTPPTPTWTPPPANLFPTQPSAIPTTQPELVSTFTPPATTSPLDNPWSTPVQQPSSPQPTWVPPAQSSAPLPAPVMPEPAPTDLSHLISNNSTAPETLVVPSAPAAPNTPQMPTLPNQDHKGIPKWLIGVAVVLLIIVIGASAYFILGIGQPKSNTSVPAEVTKTTIKTPAPIASPASQSNTSAATGSANFGQLQGSNSASPQATSAADLARQRQQGR